MSRWYRVFCRSELQPGLDDVRALLVQLGEPEAMKVAADDDGWTCVETWHLWIECFLASEEGIRAQLNTWAAWMESRDNVERQGELMEHLIQTQQLYTIQRQREGESGSDGNQLPIEERLAQYLASAANGFYQVDGAGFFAANGVLVAQED